MANQKLKFANLKVGITVLIGIIIFFVFVTLIGTEINYFSKTKTYKIFISNVEGFSVGSMVALGGLKIGSVEDIGFAKKDGVNGVDVSFTVNEKYQNQITINSVASIKNKGLLGDKYIDISIGQVGETPLESNSYLPLAQQITLESFTNKLAPMMDNLSGILENLNTITSSLSNKESAMGILLNDKEAGTELKLVIRKLNQFATTISDKNGTLGKLANDATLYNNLSSLTNNLSEMTKSLNDGEGTLGKLLNDDKLYDQFNGISKRLDNLLAKTESDSTMIGGMLNDGEMYKQFNSLIIDLDKLLIDLKENPDRYVQFSVF